MDDTRKQACLGRHHRYLYKIYQEWLLLLLLTKSSKGSVSREAMINTEHKSEERILNLQTSRSCRLHAEMKISQEIKPYETLQILHSTSCGTCTSVFIRSSMDLLSSLITEAERLSWRWMRSALMTRSLHALCVVWGLNLDTHVVRSSYQTVKHVR